MATEITMPKLSDTMTEGKFLAWKKSVGERVERGEIIALVETDKATMELEAFASGVLLETRARPGETVAVGTVIGIIGAAGEQPAPQPSPQLRETAPAPPSEPMPSPVSPEELRTGVAVAPMQAAEKEKASPLVRRLAREHGIDLAQVSGSGPEGRILKEDLEAHVARQTGVAGGIEDRGTGLEEQIPEAAAEAAVPPPAAGVAGLQPLSRMRAAIARTVSEAWRTIPHFSVTMSIDMGEVERVRQELKDAGTPVSINDLIVKAVAVALQKFPRLNSSFSADGITPYPDINIGIAVALEDGLLVPVIRGCQGLSLKEIAARSRELVEKARGGKLAETELGGGTFSVSNLGMYGVEEFTAVIHPPQGGILAVGAVTDQPLIRNGRQAAARLMRVTLSADHRLVDGAYAGRFLQELKHALENPVGLLL